jgi:hypothetical protein
MSDLMFVVKLLLEKGAKVDAKVVDGSTATRGSRADFIREKSKY